MELALLLLPLLGGALAQPVMLATGIAAVAREAVKSVLLLTITVLVSCFWLWPLRDASCGLARERKEDSGLVEEGKGTIAWCLPLKIKPDHAFCPCALAVDDLLEKWVGGQIFNDLFPRLQLRV